MRKILQEYKSQMYTLITELKEKHRLQRRSILTATKTNRKYRYEDKETVVTNSQRMSHEDEDLPVGIVAQPVLRKALTECEDQREIPNFVFARVSFHIPNKTDDKEETEI